VVTDRVITANSKIIEQRGEKILDAGEIEKVDSVVPRLEV
jgi:hypothetical protein